MIAHHGSATQQSSASQAASAQVLWPTPRSNGGRLTADIAKGKRPTGMVQVVDVAIVDVVPASDNPRQTLGRLDDLIASIRAVGILQPLLVIRQADLGRYMIVCGARRWAAALEAGLRSLPCIVRELTETERVEAMLVENLQRSNLTKLEEAHAYERLLGLGYTQHQIARRVGKSQSYVCRRMLLLALPVDVRDQVERGQLPVDRALGYEPAVAEDAFVVDEALQKAWIALRHEVLALGDQSLTRLLSDFALALARHGKLAAERGRPQLAALTVDGTLCSARRPVDPVPVGAQI
jgi:ParB family chromosome partitioning protein